MTMPLDERPSLYAMLKAEGCELSSHETDLYVVVTPAAKEIIALYESYGGKSNKEFFASAIDKRPHYDLPFHYQPRWSQRSGATSYADGKPSALSDIESLGDETWTASDKDGRKVALRIKGSMLVVGVAPEGESSSVAVAALQEPLPGAERYRLEVGDLLDRAAGRTGERLFVLAGFGIAAPEPSSTPKV